MVAQKPEYICHCLHHLGHRVSPSHSSTGRSVHNSGGTIPRSQRWFCGGNMLAPVYGGCGGQEALVSNILQFLFLISELEF